VVRTGRQRPGIIEHRAGPPHTKTFGVMSVASHRHAEFFRLHMPGRRMIAAVALAASFLIGCAEPKPTGSDLWPARLRIGMSKDEVVAALGLPSDRNKLFFSDDYYYFRRGEVVPYDLLRTISDGTEKWLYPYWINSNTQNFLSVFFSGESKVIGWVKDHSGFTREKYKHEKLTSQLKRDLTETEIRRLLGPPEGFAKRPDKLQEEARELYADHYWSTPLSQGRGDMWVYSYELPSGNRRKVHLLWWPNKLRGWGYDRAHEEAERYLRQSPSE
jgi:hypothetical protein